MQKNKKIFSTSFIRKSFIDFFKRNGHFHVPSSSLVPINDSSLLFTNSGMVQFKDIFLGKMSPPYASAVSSQNCLRAGGKHNDLENVGYTSRHHTFFEMLGNFSFGNYFKEDAIKLSWELLTDVFEIEAERLLVTVYKDDDETYKIWKKLIKLDEDKIILIGDNKGSKYQSDNFWQMAETGPCGPCTEIFYDHGELIKGGPPGSSTEDGDRFVEIWNLVFMQFQRSSEGILTNLPKPCVDTGMGLERMSAVLNGVNSNYEIDIFKNLIASIGQLLNYENLSSPSLKVIADHIRATSFLIVDGVTPGSEGRNYVLRRIIRRAIRHAYKLGQTQPFFHKIVKNLSIEMESFSNKLDSKIDFVEKIILEEEERFSHTLVNGMEILQTELKKSNFSALNGSIAFMLYDTYGFPIDLTADVCREYGVSIDMSKFDQEMKRQRERAKGSNKFNFSNEINTSGLKTNFVGYDHDISTGKLLSIFKNGELVESAKKGDEVTLILSESCFYAESGGQVGDCGILKSNSTTIKILNTTKSGNAFLHHGFICEGVLKKNEQLNAEFDISNRSDIKRNHSATHLLHYALRKILGHHVEQKGSNVDANRTRFDFSHPKPLTHKEVNEVENLVNFEILKNKATEISSMSYDDAIKNGALALFGEKYDDMVRVLSIGASKELCGGTHVDRTGDIGFFKIINEIGVSSGVRRVEAVTGKKAIEHIRAIQELINNSSNFLQTTNDKLFEKITTLFADFKLTQKHLEATKKKLAEYKKNEIILDVKKNQLNTIKIIAKKVSQVSVKDLRTLADEICTYFESCFVVLATEIESKVIIIVKVSPDLKNRLGANTIASHLANSYGGKGGGRSDMAQAGGIKPENLNLALNQVSNYLDNFLEQNGEK